MVVVFSTAQGKVGLQFGDDIYIIQPEQAIAVAKSILTASKVIGDFNSVKSSVKH